MLVASRCARKKNPKHYKHCGRCELFVLVRQRITVVGGRKKEKAAVVKIGASRWTVTASNGSTSCGMCHTLYFHRAKEAASRTTITRLRAGLRPICCESAARSGKLEPGKFDSRGSLSSESSPTVTRTSQIYFILFYSFLYFFNPIDETMPLEQLCDTSYVCMDTNDQNKGPIRLKTRHANTSIGRFWSDSVSSKRNLIPNNKRWFVLISISNGVHVHTHSNPVFPTGAKLSPLCKWATSAWRGSGHFSASRKRGGREAKLICCWHNFHAHMSHSD